MMAQLENTLLPRVWPRKPETLIWKEGYILGEVGHSERDETIFFLFLVFLAL